MRGLGCLPDHGLFKPAFTVWVINQTGRDMGQLTIQLADEVEQNVREEAEDEKRSVGKQVEYILEDWYDGDAE